MKLMICIVNDYYTSQIEKEMNNKGYRMTELSSSGGFIKKGSTTFLFGVDEGNLENLKSDLEEACTTLEAKKGRQSEAPRRFTYFVLSAENAAFFGNPMNNT
ncbi:cyclic-di-AMP receptor [Salibacterium halotolerans]|uniref:Cyclic-di-AMP receptor n=1 Tax=Salibacterium halotolerans TaxID=1884432 RepID=A0A1I5RD49_9BACI|nr:cyclic-di-AMP receptor [Salibacterium halotolerans]SFP56463.1 Cyclic-di-AMP receptor [Salibacterium halotolerans]